MKPSPRDADITHVKLSEEPQQLQQPSISYKHIFIDYKYFCSKGVQGSEKELQNKPRSGIHIVTKM